MSNLPLILHQANLLTTDQQPMVSEHLANNKVSISGALIATGCFTSHDLVMTLARQFAMPIVNMGDYGYEGCCRELNQRDIVLRHRVLPLSIEGNTVNLAVSDPSNMDALDELRFATGKNIEPQLVSHDDLEAAIRRIYGSDIGENKNTQGKAITDTDLGDMVDVDISENTDEVFDLTQDTAPVSRYINQVLLDAVRKKASDIHFEPYETFYRIRFRCDGILQQHATPPSHLSRRLSTRLKVMSKLNIAERLQPQDGRIKIKLNDTLSVDLRVSCLLTLWGEKLVLRILDSSSANLDIDILGYNPQQKQLYLKALEQPQGMILITGPTGSGKTVSLYTGLRILNTDTRNISTAEDPVEINLAGINQVQINNKVGLSFAAALKSFLRQDPDIVMVGEVRDIETAEIAMKAAQTGHLVLSTLHTNSAAETLTRLLNMGVADYNLASSLSLIIAQRLARRLCPQCKQPHTLDPILREKLGIMSNATIYQANPQGCNSCNQGYMGRVGIYEVMSFSKPLGAALLSGATTQKLEDIACQEGMQTLAQSGIEKLTEGVTSLSELQRLIHQL